VRQQQWVFDCILISGKQNWITKKLWSKKTPKLKRLAVWTKGHSIATAQKGTQTETASRRGGHFAMIYFSKMKLAFPQVCHGPALFLILLVGFVASGEDAAPPSPNNSWSPPGLNQYEQELTNKDLYAKQDAMSVEINPEKVYDLPELIDIAERSNPDTRIAWEQARQAAKAVGLSQSAYYPYLAASAAASYQRELAVLTSVFPSHVGAEIVTLDMKWLLFDFGERKAATTSAREQLMMANVSFNATHQQIVST